MSCCSQTFANPWWATNPVEEGQKPNVFGVGPSDHANGQWYYYVGRRQGATLYGVPGKEYYAGRAGRSRFVDVQVEHVERFERAYGNEFVLLGASDAVVLKQLLQPAIDLPATVALGVDERTLRQADLARTGHVVAADPSDVVTHVGLTDAAARAWILQVRSALGFGNVIQRLAGEARPATRVAGSAAAKSFDFGALHGVTAEMESALAGEGIVSAAGFIALGHESLATLLEIPPPTAADLIEEVGYQLRDKG